MTHQARGANSPLLARVWSAARGQRPESALCASRGEITCCRPSHEWLFLAALLFLEWVRSPVGAHQRRVRARLGARQEDEQTAGSSMSFPRFFPNAAVPRLYFI